MGSQIDCYIRISCRRYTKAVMSGHISVVGVSLCNTAIALPTTSTGPLPLRLLSAWQRSFRCFIEPRATKTTAVVRHFDRTVHYTSHCSPVRLCVFLEVLTNHFSRLAKKIKQSVEVSCNSCTNCSYSLLRLIWQVESCSWLPCWCSEVPLALILASVLPATESDDGTCAPS